ncbi:DUF4157 domain-containing protein, partial [Chloroflexota bacterium]
SEAGEMSSELSARAFTHGRDIYLGQGQLNTESEGGQRLLAHELTHVVQQTGAGHPQIQRALWGLFKRKRKLQTAGSDLYNRSVTEFQKLKRPRRKGGVSASQREVKAVEYFHEQLAEAGDVDRAEKDIRDAYQDVFNEYLPAVRKEKLETAQVAAGSMDASTPDYVNEAIKDKKPDQRKVTIVVVQSQSDWVDKFKEFRDFFTNQLKKSSALRVWAAEAWDQVVDPDDPDIPLKKRLAPAIQVANERVAEEFKTLKDEVGSPGHAWVRLSTYVKGALQKLFTFGFYPRKHYDPVTSRESGGYQGFLTGGPGQVRHPDTIHEGDHDDYKRMYDYKVGPKRFARALAKAQERFENPPPYVLMVYSCATFVREVVNAAGKTFPGKGLFPKSSFTPGYLFDALKNKRKAYGYGTKEKELTEEEQKSDKKKAKKEKWLEKKKDPLAAILEDVEEEREERQEKGRTKLRQDIQKKEEHERLVQEIADTGISTKEDLLLLPLDIQGLLYGLLGQLDKGGELLAQSQDEIRKGFVFDDLNRGLESATGKFKDLSDDVRPVTLGSLGSLDEATGAMVADLLGLSTTQLEELYTVLGVTPELEREKTELGRELGLPEEALRAMTHADVVVYEILRELKSDKKDINIATITQGIYEAGLAKEDLARLTNLTSVGLDQISAKLQMDRTELRNYLMDVQLLGPDPWGESGERETETQEPEPEEEYGEEFEEELEEQESGEMQGAYKTTDQGAQRVYALDAFRPLCELPGGTPVTGLGRDPDMDVFVHIRFTTEEGGEQTGRVHESVLVPA